MLNIAEKREQLRRELERKEAILIVLEEMNTQRDWCMPFVKDEEGKDLQDESGHYVRRVPTEEDWCYERYCAWNIAIAEVEKLVK